MTRRLALALLSTVAFVTVLWVPSAANADDAAGLRLDPGPAIVEQAVHLGFTVTNTSSVACGLTTSGDGVLSIVSVTRDGTEVTPVVGEVFTEDGLGSAIAADLAPVDPGASVSVDLRSIPTAGSPLTLESVAALPTGDGLAQFWVVDQPGRYEVTAVYAVPTVVEAAVVEAAVGTAAVAPCSATSAPAVISFTIGDGHGLVPGGARRWLLIGGGGVVVLLLVVAVIVLVTRSRSRTGGGRTGGGRTGGGRTDGGRTGGGRTGGAVAAGLALVIGASALAVLGSARPAAADYSVDPDASSAGATAVDNCVALLEATDPNGLGKWVKESKTPVRIIPAEHTTSKSSDTGAYKPGSSTIVWDYSDNSADYENEPGLARDPCASLAHEIQHSKDISDHSKPKGTAPEPGGLPGDPGDGGAMCGDTGIKKREVRATFAENDYRVAHGLDPHTHYDGKPLPKSLDECDKKPSKKAPQKPSKGPQKTFCESGSPDGCGSTNGDPHLVTFDKARYDMQAVGEFEVVRSTSGDPLEVQARQQPLPNSSVAAINTAVAFGFAAHSLSIALVNGISEIRIDGTVTPVSQDETSLPGNATLIRRDSDTSSQSGYEVLWADGSSAAVDQVGTYGYRLLFKLDQSRAGAVEGLLGNFDGDPTNDVALPDGSILSAPFTYDELYPAYADAWRVTDATSLLPYGPGQSTQSFTDRGFPTKPFSIDDLDAATRDRLTEICQAAGIVEAWQLNDCIYDVAITGRVDFALADATSEGLAPTGLNLPPTTPIAVATLREPGDQFTFAAAAGDIVYVDAAAVTRVDQCAPLRLLDPVGAEVARGCLVGADGGIDRTTLSMGGQYTVRLDDSVTGEGPVVTRVYLVHDVAGTLALNQIVGSELRDPGSVLRLTFPGQAGQRYFIDEIDSTVPASCDLRLLDPAGTDIGYGCVLEGDGYLETPALPATGTYTLTMDPAGTDWGSVDFRLTTITDVTGTIAINGAPVVATITTPGGTARYTFTGTAGSTVSVRVSGRTLPYYCGTPRLLDPAGDALAIGCVLDDGDSYSGIAATTLPTTGTYTVLVDPGGEDTGSVTLTLRG